jgi:hypothetical protein
MSNKQSRTMVFEREQGPGSVQHFAHFMMDYFIYIAVWCSEHPGRSIVVRDCGPCNPWFDLLPGKPNVTILSAAELALRANRASPQNLYVTKNRFRVNDVREHLQRFRQIMSEEPQNEKPSGRIMAIRTIDHEFYSSARSEIPTSGPTRRTISNQETISRQLRKRLGVESVEFFHLDPTTAVTKVSQSSLFIAQRGAAMMNMLFLPPGSHVVEITPRQYKELDLLDLYRELSEMLDLTFTRIWQKTEFSKVSWIRVLISTGLDIARIRVSRRLAGKRA